MRDPARIARIINHLHHIWLQYPDLRYGQLMYNLYSIFFHSRGYVEVISDYAYMVEDSDWEEFLANFKGFE